MTTHENTQPDASPVQRVDTDVADALDVDANQRYSIPWIQGVRDGFMLAAQMLADAGPHLTCPDGHDCAHVSETECAILLLDRRARWRTDLPNTQPA